MSVIKKQKIFLPNLGVDASKWAVISGSEFKWDKEFWQTVENYVSSSPSTLNMILPDINLTNDDKEKIKKINDTMVDYFMNRVVIDRNVNMVLTCRSTPWHRDRLGFVFTVDLDDYDYHEEGKGLIKNIKPTIIEKVAPRMEIRKNAILETSHIVLLYDDRERNLAGDLYNNRANLQKLYDFNLNMGGGHLSGYQIKDVDDVIRQFDRLGSEEYAKKYYNSDRPLLFIVGDGNHSLSVAKAHWERLKKTLSPELLQNHPARYALVEAVSIYDPGVEFKGIHKIIKNVNIRRFIKGIKKITHRHFKRNEKKVFTMQRLFVEGKEIQIKMPYDSLIATKKVQEYIDNYLENELEMTIDYTPSFDRVKDECTKDTKSIGIIIEGFDKSKIFEYVLKYNFLPRKTFELFRPIEKRYNYEVHKIKLI